MDYDVKNYIKTDEQTDARIIAKQTKLFKRE